MSPSQQANNSELVPLQIRRLIMAFRSEHLSIAEQNPWNRKEQQRRKSKDTASPMDSNLLVHLQSEERKDCAERVPEDTIRGQCCRQSVFGSMKIGGGAAG